MHSWGITHSLISLRSHRIKCSTWCKLRGRLSAEELVWFDIYSTIVYYLGKSSHVIEHSSNFSLIPSLIDRKISCYILSQSDIQLAQARFPALWPSHVSLLWVLIGFFWYLTVFWPLVVISLGLTWWTNAPKSSHLLLYRRILPRFL